jgi:hypothetical protein
VHVRLVNTVGRLLLLHFGTLDSVNAQEPGDDYRIILLQFHGASPPAELFSPFGNDRPFQT